MLLDLAITAGGILPFYLGLIVVLRKQYDQKFSRLLRIFLLAGLSTVPFFGLQMLGINQALFSSLLGPLYAMILLAFSEEFVKSVALYFDHELKHQYYYPILVGLGFAFFENISYLMGFEFTITFLSIAIIRLFTVSTAHALFTSLITHFIQKGTRKTRTWYYLLGLLIAGSCHSLFNLLHHWEMSYLVVPLLIVLIVFLHFDEVHSQSRPLPSPALPPLRLKKASTH